MSWRYAGARDADGHPLRRLGGLWRHRLLIRRMAHRELRQRYAGTALGYLWAAVYPLVLVTFYALVFTFVFRGRLSPGAPPQEYALYVVSGLLPWIAFTEVASRATQAMAEHRGLVKFAVFPVQILPLAGLYASLVSQAVGVLALVLFAMATHGGLTARVVLLVPAVCLQLVFLAGVAWLLGAVGAVLRDVRELIGVALTAGMFVTPIFYLERDAPAPLRLLLAANPLTHLINMYRYALLPLEPFPITSVAIFLVWSAISLLAGFWVFDRTRVFLADIL